jgi:CTP:molybdopterin cytidylyltransferase MocA
MRGRDKLLEKVRGMAILRRQTLAALATGLDVVVLVRPDDQARRNVLNDLGVIFVDVPDARDGMSSTLRLAAAWPTPPRPMMLLLPDVPGVTRTEILAVLDAFNGTDPVRASDPDGRPGTPIVFPARLLPRFAELNGDSGGREILSDETVALVRFEDDRATRDLDSPEDWDDWRAGR